MAISRSVYCKELIHLVFVAVCYELPTRSIFFRCGLCFRLVISYYHSLYVVAASISIALS